MTLPVTRVYIWFDLSATGGDFFTLNHPSKGMLDNTNFKLAGDLITEVTDDVEDLNFRRGRSRVLDEIPAGTGTVRFLNPNRDYDPFYASSPYAGNIVPGKRIKVTSNGVSVFDGQIGDWTFDYDEAQLTFATAIMEDGLAALGRKRFSAWTTTSQLPGARINDVLDRSEVAYTENRDIDDGVETLQADNVSFGSNVLNYLQLVNRSDAGRFFAARNGTITFRDRTTILNSMTAAEFSDTGQGIPFASLSFARGSEFLYNRVTVDREGGIAQTVSDSVSQSAYGIRALSETGLLLNSDTRSLAFADYLLNLYKDPEVRIASLEIDLAGLSSDLVESVLDLDSGSLVSITFTPDAIGDPIEKFALVEGIAHRITGSSHTVTLSLGAADTRSFLQLDEPEFGQLDSNLLAF